MTMTEHTIEIMEEITIPFDPESAYYLSEPRAAAGWRVNGDVMRGDAATK